MNALINVDIYDYYSYRPDSYVVYDAVIRETGNMYDFDRANVDPSNIIDGKGTLLMPGHIVGHGHIYSAFARGLQISPFSPETFTQRLQQLWWKLDSGYDLDATYQSARVYGIEFIKSGVTTLFDHHASGIIPGSLTAIKKGLIDEIGMRGVLCFETSDRFDVDQCIKENLEFAKGNSNPKCRGMFGMHASLTLSQETLGKIASVRGNIPVHVHLGESLEEELESLNKYGQRVAQRYDSFKLLDKDALLAHCTNIDDSEAELIGERGCVAALNPTANINANNGIPDAGMMKRHKVPMIIGSDSLGTNITRDYQNMYYLMQTRLNDRTTKKFSQQDLLSCIRNVYSYAGRMLGVKLGRIEPGYEADLVTVPYRISTAINESNAFSYVMNGVYTHYFPRDVVIGGELKMRNFETIFDEQEIYAKSREAAMRIWNQIGSK